MTKTALIVDDNFFNRDLAGMALKHAGYEIVEAEDGREALTKLASCEFNLLLLDLAMPEVSGAQVLKEVRAQSKYDKMRIIIMTANHHMTTDEMDNLADFIIYKPIDMMQFTNFVQRL